MLTDPAAPGSNPSSVEIFSLYCFIRGQHRDQTHLVLKQGISQMQLTVKPVLLQVLQKTLALIKNFRLKGRRIGSAKKSRRLRKRGAKISVASSSSVSGSSPTKRIGTRRRSSTVSSRKPSLETETSDNGRKSSNLSVEFTYRPVWTSQGICKPQEMKLPYRPKPLKPVWA